MQGQARAAARGTESHLAGECAGRGFLMRAMGFDVIFSRMRRNGVCVVVSVLVSCLCGASTRAQDQPDETMKKQLIFARAEYYTPTSKGLQSLRCDAAIDWKALLARFGGTDVADDNPYLKYLQGVHLTVSDDLHGQGGLAWAETTPPPQGKEDAAGQIHGGLQQMVNGFFQSWNGFMNGSIIPVPDKTVALAATDSGMHLHGTDADTQLDEDFDKNFLLTQVVAVTPAVRVVALPAYIKTDDGLVVSAITSQVNQPPTAPPIEVTFHVEYATVQSFRIPSRIVYDVQNVGTIEVNLNACQVKVAEPAKTPAGAKSN
jgi:hypothetical protein